MAETWKLSDDLDDVLARTHTLWPSLKGARIFLTGGTGFIGCWLLESLRHANEHHRLGISATVLTRNPTAFADKAPHLAHYPGFEFIQGDVSTFASPTGEFTHLIHAATEASADLNENDPRRMFDTVVTGTRRALDFAVEKNIGRTLFLSSGAVYGQQPWEMTHVPETWQGAPDCLNARNTYAEAKRTAEMLCAIYAKQFGIAFVSARIFALLGPYISLGIHFAAGNFIRDAMDRKPIIVNGNGLPVRSYLYAGDLTAWLWHLLVRGTSGAAYNVGSEEGISIRDLAEKVATLVGTGEFTVRGAADTGWNPGRYVPETKLIANQFGLYRSVSLDDAIRRTALWNGWKHD